MKPDKANASALALLPRDSAHRLDRLWTLVQDTCPLPLLDHWRGTVLEAVADAADADRSSLGPSGRWKAIGWPRCPGADEGVGRA